MNKLLLTMLLTSSIFSIRLNAQIEKTIYQSFHVEDSTFKFKLNINDPYEVVTWNGANVMIETTINFKGAPLDLLVLVIKDGRYTFSTENNYPTTVIKNIDRWALKNGATNTAIEEKIVHRIYVPEEFQIVSNKEIIRRGDIIADNRQKN